MGTQEALFQHVDCLAGLIGPRILAKPKSIEASLGYLRKTWNEMGYEVKEEPYDAGQCEARNLVVEVPGTHEKDSIVLLGAHYDTVDTTPGADDNASAVAVLLEVSRRLRETKCRRTMRFVAFACEEQPYLHSGGMGSQHHARKARRTGEKILAMLCLEMVGYFRDEPNSQLVPDSIPRFLHPLFPKRGNFLAAIGNIPSWKLGWWFRRGFKKGTKLPLFSLSLPEKIQEIRRSDNSSFWDQEYPALMLTDTSFLRNPNYHQPSDTPDTLDYVRMSQVVDGVTAAMKYLAKGSR